VIVVSDLNKNIGGSTDVVEKRHGLADLHNPIHPPRSLMYSNWHEMQIAFAQFSTITSVNMEL